MSTISLDNNNNIQLQNGNLYLKEEKEGLAQDIKNSLLIWKGENPFDTEQGIQYDEDILGKMGGIEFVKEQVQGVIYKNKEVSDIEKIEIIKKQDNLLINTFINSIYGKINV